MPEQQPHRLRRLPNPDRMLKYEKCFLTAEILGWITLVVGGGSAAVVIFGAPSSPVSLKVALAGLLLLWLLLKLRGTLTFRHQRRIRAQQGAVAQEAATSMLDSAETYTCPVCGYPGLDSPPSRDGLAFWDICPSCGTEFGNDDANRTHEQLREAWIAKGMPWWSTSPRDPPPEGWDPGAQLLAAGF